MKNTKSELMLSLLDRLEFRGTFFVWKPEYLPAKGRDNGRAGSIDWSGYDVITFQGKRFKVHQLVWLLKRGRPIPDVIDHIDGDKTNNHPDNLRASNTVENGHNRAEHRQGKLLGTSFRKDNGKWVAQRWENGKKVYLGQYNTMEEAHAAYKEGLCL